MRITCDIAISSRASSDLCVRNAKPCKATLALGKTTGKKKTARILVCTAKNKAGQQFLVEKNVQQIFDKRADAGMMTLRLENPPVDLLISKANAGALRTFIAQLKVASEGRSLNELKTIALAPAKSKDFQKKEPISLNITSRTSYPFLQSFPRELLSLSVKSCDLRKFDLRIPKLTYLTSLELSSNDFSAHVNRIVLSSLPNLQTLVLSNDRLPAEMPLEFWVGLPDSLNVLNLDHNHIENIPNGALRRLKRLRCLSLAQNHITRLSSEVGTLGSLQKLILSKNKFYSLPATIAWLRNLQLLDLHGNQKVLGVGTGSTASHLGPTDPLSLLHIAGLAVVRFRLPRSELPRTLNRFLDQFPPCVICRLQCSPDILNRAFYCENFEFRRVTETFVGPGQHDMPCAKGYLCGSAQCEASFRRGNFR